MGDGRYSARELANTVSRDGTQSSSESSIATQAYEYLQTVSPEERTNQLRSAAAELERDGTLPNLLLQSVSMSGAIDDTDANGNGIRDSVDGGDDFTREDVLRMAQEADTLQEQILAQALLDRFAIIEAADNHLYGMATGVQDNRAGIQAFEAYAFSHDIVGVNADGSSIVRDQNGNITQVVHPNGSSMHFVYNANHQLTQYTTNDGSVFKFEDGVLRQYQPDGLTPTGIEYPGESAVVDSRGNLSLIHADGTYSVYRTDGSVITYDNAGQIVGSEGIVSETAAVVTLSREGLDEAATFLHDALRPAFLANIDSDAIFDRLETMTEADRRALETYYFQRYGISLRQDLDDILWDDDANRALAILDRTDNEANDVGQLFTSLDVLNRTNAGYGRMPSDDIVLTGDSVSPEAQIVVFSWSNLSHEQYAAEKEMRDMFSVLNSQEIAQLNADYEARYGITLTEAILANPNVSPQTKAAIEIYLRGTDQRTDADVVALANIALNSGDGLMFQEALRGSSESERELLMSDPTVRQRIETQFDGADRQLAFDYLETGNARLSTLVRGDTHWLHTNKEAIVEACNNASDEERRLFAQGRQIALEGREPVTQEERDALTYYNEVHTAFSGAAYEWEVLGWESLLLYDNTLIRDVSSFHHDGALGSAVGSYNDDRFIIERIQNMSEEEWRLLSGYTESTDPLEIEAAQRRAEEFRAYLDNTLDAMWITGDDRRRLADMLDWMQNATTFAEAGRTQNVEQLFLDFSGSGAFGTYGRDTSRILDGVLNISLEEAERIRNDEEYYLRLVSLTEQNLDDGPMTVLALRYLERIRNSSELTEESLSLDPSEIFLYQAVNKASASALIASVESNPELLELIRSNEVYRNIFDDALDETLAEEQVEQVVIDITDDGRLSLSLRFELCKNTTERFTALQTVTEEERLLLLDNSGTNPEAIALQAAVFGDLNAEERQLFIRCLESGLVDREGQMVLNIGPEELVRAYVLGCGDVDVVRALFSSEELTNEQKTAIFNAYAADFGSDLVADVLRTVGSSGEFEFEQLLAVTDVDARQQFYDLNHDLNSSFGVLDGFMEESWDYTRVQAFEQANDFAAGLASYSRVFEEMPPEVQQEYAESLNTAIELYRRSKGEMADAVVEALITAATIAATLVATVATGGVGLALIVNAAIASGLFKVGAKALIEGSDYEVSAESLLTDLATGALSGALNMIGPELGGAIIGLGRRAAANAASRVFASLASQFGDDILGAAGREALESGLRSLVSRALSNGMTEIPERGIIRLAESIATEALGEGVDEASRRVFVEALVTEMRLVLGEEVQSAAGSYLRRLVTEGGMNSFAGVLGGGGSGAFYGVLNYDTSRSFGENLQQIAASAVMGAGAGFVGAAVFTAGFKFIGMVVEVAGRPVIMAVRELRGTIDGRPTTVPEGSIVPDDFQPSPDDTPAYVGDGITDATPANLVGDSAPIAGTPLVDAVNSVVDDLPAPLRAPLESNGVQINVVDDLSNSQWAHLADSPVPGQPGRTFRDVPAFYDPVTRRIVVVADNISNPNMLREVISEEAAHALDHMIGMSTRSSDWRFAFQMERLMLSTRDLIELGYQGPLNRLTSTQEAAQMAINIVLKNGENLTPEEAFFAEMFPNTLLYTRAEMARAGVIPASADLPPLSPLRVLNSEDWNTPLASDNNVQNGNPTGLPAGTPRGDVYHDVGMFRGSDPIQGLEGILTDGQIGGGTAKGGQLSQNGGPTNWEHTQITIRIGRTPDAFPNVGRDLQGGAGINWFMTGSRGSRIDINGMPIEVIVSGVDDADIATRMQAAQDAVTRANAARVRAGLPELEVRVVSVREFLGSERYPELLLPLSPGQQTNVLNGLRNSPLEWQRGVGDLARTMSPAQFSDALNNGWPSAIDSIDPLIARPQPQGIGAANVEAFHRALDELSLAEVIVIAEAMRRNPDGTAAALMDAFEAGERLSHRIDPFLN